jgi:hypothetical protein
VTLLRSLRQRVRDSHAQLGTARFVSHSLKIIFAFTVLVGIVVALTIFAIIDEPAATRQLTYAILATGAAIAALLALKRTWSDWIGFVLLAAGAGVLWAYYLELVRFPVIQGVL